MPRTILSFLTVLALNLTLALTAQADLLYVTGNSTINGDGGGSFGTINTGTGVYTEIATYTLPAPNNLVWNGTSFYVIQGAQYAESLQTLTTGGVVTTAGQAGPGFPVYGMAYDSANSKMYAYDYMQDKLWTVNTTTGASEPIGLTYASTSPPVGGRLAVLNNVLYGALYNSGAGGFGTFDTGSGLFTQTATNDLFQSMNLATDGTTLYGIYSDGSTTRNLYTIDPGSGETTFVNSITGSNLPDYWTGASFGPAAVPEPSTYALLCISLGVVGFARKKMAVKP